MIRKAYDNQQNPQTQLKFFKNVFITVPIVIYVKKEFYLLKALNDKIRYLKASGLVKFWHFQDVEQRFLDPKNQDDHPKVLNFKMFIGCFQVLSLGCILSCFVFIFEKTCKAKSLMMLANKT